ncbi:hypothetical protein R3P38DRAFT_3206275 [Favolaschia claudopus]|uniref:Bacteriophage T5 Orf172 DNA-binding domain-containing protein n=1 Tax=Favolaschia claudopus TaxID=2862362 RepID=A0AAW0AKK3_9AGAR
MSPEDRIKSEMKSLQEQSQYFGINRVYCATEVIDLLKQPLSKSEEKGNLYWYKELLPDGRIQFKAGRTNDVVRRMGQWEKKCYKSDIELLKIIETVHSHRLEQAVHLWFKVAGAWIVPYPCVSCGTRHREKFEFDEEIEVDVTELGGIEKAIQITEILRDMIDA